MTNKNTTNIAFTAFFTALICILSQISFVTPTVPVTLQTFGVALCGFTLSVKWSGACIATYIALGSLGMPIFSAFQGGMQVTLGPTGGFIFGFVILAVTCSFSAKINKRYLCIIISSTGLLLCHITGVLQYSLITGNSLLFSLITVSLPFLLKDMISLIGAFFLSKYVIKRIKSFKF